MSMRVEVAPARARAKSRARKGTVMVVALPPDTPNAARSVVSTREQLHERIAEAAYYIAEKRSFAPGSELDDWLAAEQEIIGTCGGLS